MSQDRPQISRKHAERIIDGMSGGTLAGSARPDPLITRLLKLLIAATGPTQKGELAGEEAASTAFRRHAATPVPPRVNWAMPPLRRFISLKVVALAMATTATGGFALASATDTLQLGLDLKPRPIARPAKPPSRPAAASPTSSPAPPPSPPLAQVNLCRTFKAAAQSNPSQALRDPAFSPLAAASGGTDKIPGYCTRLLVAADPKPDPSGTKQQKPKKSGAPTDPERPGPDGKPEDPGSQGQPRPSNRPSKTPPKGKPSKPHAPGSSARPKPR